MKFIKISSKDNLLIKKIVKLATDAKLRNKEKLALIFGKHLVEEAIKYNRLQVLLMDISNKEQYEDLLQIVQLEEVYLLPSKLIDKINLLDSATDIVGLINVENLDVKEGLYEDDCLILENIQDPGNLGTILRSCASTGVKNIILSKDCVDVYNPKVLRSSQGIQFGLNIYRNIDLIDFVNKYNKQLIITTPYATKSIYDFNFTSHTAFIFGNESIGVTRALSHIVNSHVKIPMVEGVESINVAMAATVCLFEMYRQRIK